MTRIYMLTQRGQAIARSPHNPDTNGFRVVYYLDRVGHATPEQVEDGTGVPNCAGILAILNRRGIVQDVAAA